MLPDDVLLEIFDFCCFCMDEYVARELYLAYWDSKAANEDIEAWQSLAHVCRRWRSIIFGSPRRLNLELVCTAKTSARHMLDIWPAFPVLIRENECREGIDNIISLLKHRDRVRQINLMEVPSSTLEKVWAAMQEPFPELAHLLLWSDDYRTAPVFLDSFLGGSAPLLRFLWLDHIPFPSLPKLLLSATHLVDLYLRYIPHSGYISPEALVTALSTLTSFKSLWLTFQSPQSHPDQENQRPPPLTRLVLPVLALLRFEGVSEYLEDLVARIDTPLLDRLDITFFNQVVFNTPQLAQFISLTPMSKALAKAHIVYEPLSARVKLSSRTSDFFELKVGTLCTELDWQVSSLEQVCTSSLPPLSVLEELYIYEKSNYWRPNWQDSNIENTLWLELLYRFTAVKDLYLSENVAPYIMSALRELVGDRTTEVLPTLQNIWLEGQPSEPVQETIGQFIAARQGSSHSIVITRWER